ncbi:MAG: aspartate-semialdehyde dehydrogenase [Planctomycetota bacterium]|nr:MAG: aspartate-semialdehyde dehydrogenase [Planctomycetota bacterium]
MGNEKFHVAVVGVGAVGKELVRILEERRFPIKKLTILGRTRRREKIGGQSYEVLPASSATWEEVDLALFAGTEGAKGACAQYGWQAVRRGVVVIDNGDDFRMDPRVPLVVPQINPQALRDHQGMIANPNCSTIQMVMALWPLHKVVPLKEVIVSTYQAVSGSGSAGIQELREQTSAVAQGQRPYQLACKVYPQPIFSNAIPQISSPVEEPLGYFREEWKMMYETRKIFSASDLKITATCVRVPVFNAHSEAITARFESAFPLSEAQRALQEAPGVCFIPSGEFPPTPLFCSGQDKVYVGRLRQSSLGEDTLEMWVVADNLRKGAALNAVEIAEALIEQDLLRPFSRRSS